MRIASPSSDRGRDVPADPVRSSGARLVVGVLVVVAARPAAALRAVLGGAGCPNLLQRPGSRRSAGSESLIFRVSSRGRSRPGAPLQQIWTTARPESSQEPHAHHRAGARTRRTRMRAAGPSGAARRAGSGAPVPPVVPATGLAALDERARRPRPAGRLAWRDGVSHVVTPPTRDPSATPLHSPLRPFFPYSGGGRGAADGKGRSRGRTGAAGAKGRGGRSPDAPNRKSYPPVSRDFSAGSASHSSEPETAKVSHCASEPESMPVVNHRTRCSDEPCVQVSESTPLPERCWMWSSPTAAAASSAV